MGIKGASAPFFDRMTRFKLIQKKTEKKQVFIKMIDDKDINPLYKALTR